MIGTLLTASCSFGGGATTETVLIVRPDDATSVALDVSGQTRVGQGRARAAFARNDHTIVVTTVGVYSVGDDDTITPFDTPDGVGQFRAAALSTDGEYLAVATDQPAVQWYDTTDGSLLTDHPLEPTEAVIDIVAAGPGAAPIALTGLGALQFDHPTDEVIRTSFPDGSSLAGTAGVLASGVVVVPLADSTSVWLVADGEDTTVELPVPDGNLVADVHVSPDSGLLAVTSWPGGDAFERADTISIIDPSTFEVIGSIEFDRPLDPSGWAVGLDGIAVGDGDTVVFYDRTGALDDETDPLATELAWLTTTDEATIAIDVTGSITTWDGPDMIDEVGDGARIVGVSNQVATVTTVDHYGRIVVIDVDGAVSSEEDRFEVGELTSVAVSPLGHVAVTSTTGRIRELDSDLDEVRAWSTGTEPVRVDTVEFDPHDGTIFTGLAERTGSQAFDDTVSAWPDAPDGPAFSVGGSAEDVAGCAFFYSRVEFAPDGSWFAATSHDFSVELIDAESGTVLGSIPPQRSAILDIALIDDDRLAVSTDDSMLTVWSVETLSAPEPIASADASMGGYQALEPLADTNDLVGLDLLGKLWVIDGATGNPERSLDGAAARSTSIAVSPDGAFVAAPTDVGSIGIWSIADGTIVATHDGHVDRVTDVAYDSTGATLVSVSIDGTIVARPVG